MADVLMPRLSSDMEEGTIVNWLKSDGDEVARGEEIVAIESDKAEVGFEAQDDGVLRILAPEGSTIAVGDRIATIGGSDGDGEQPVAVAEPAVVITAPVQMNGDEPRPPQASPVARRAAAKLGVDLGTVTGSGPRGRIFKADVVRAAGAPPAPAAPAASPESAKGASTTVELSRVQRTIARRMSESKATVPDFAVDVETDLGQLLELRERLKEAQGSAPTVTDAIVRAVALTLRKHPKVNGSYRDGALALHDRVNVGVAVATDGGLVVPVVADADRLSLSQIAAESRRLVARTRDGEVTPPELAGGTFTVSNLGMFGVDRFAGVVNLPQAAILCVGATRPRPAVLADGTIGPRPLATLTLVSDHRILYGADAAAFLADLRTLLETPLALLS